MATRIIFAVVGVVTFLVGLVLTVVQVDQVVRTRAAMIRLRDEVAELGSIPPDQRNPLEAMRFFQRKDDLRYFEEEAMPFELARLGVFGALLLTGLACTVIAWILARKRNRVASIK